MTSMFRKADIILIAVLIIAGFVMSFTLAAGRSDGTTVTVTRDGRLYGTYDLAKDQTVEIREDGGVNTFEIKDGTVRMVEADCHNKDCMQQGVISKTGQTIVCLPHKLVIEITGGEQEYDTIT